MELIDDYEYFVDIPTYEGLYMISNYATIYKVKNNRYSREYFSVSPNYRGTSLTKNGLVARFSIHKLMARVFLPNPLKRKCVNHKDGNIHNNRLSNLEWVTHQENTWHHNDVRIFLKTAGTDGVGVEENFLEMRAVRYQKELAEYQRLKAKFEGR